VAHVTRVCVGVKKEKGVDGKNQRDLLRLMWDEMREKVSLALPRDDHMS